MVRIRDVAWALTAAAAVLAGSRPATADPITLTGNVANDFTSANGSVVMPIALKDTSGDYVKNSSGQLIYTSGPDYVGVQNMVPNALPSGAFMENVAYNYNAATDTMYVGIQGFSNANGHEILGDMTGNPNAALDSNSDPSLGPVASATNSFMGSKSIALAFAPATTNAAGQTVMGTPTIIAGIPAIKADPTSTTPDFMVAQYSANSSGLPFSFGQQIANGGSLAFNTTAATPDFEFTINNFSKISGINPATSTFYIEGFDGMAGSSAGKSQFIGSQAIEAQQLPEPTTWLAWMLMAGGAGWRYRRLRTARA